MPRSVGPTRRAIPPINRRTRRAPHSFPLLAVGKHCRCRHLGRPASHPRTKQTYQSPAYNELRKRPLAERGAVCGQNCPGDRSHAAHYTNDLALDHITPMRDGRSLLDESDLRALLDRRNGSASRTGLIRMTATASHWPVVAVRAARLGLVSRPASQREQAHRGGEGGGGVQRPAIAGVGVLLNVVVPKVRVGHGARGRFGSR
jgi:hypothetical protein